MSLFRRGFYLSRSGYKGRDLTFGHVVKRLVIFALIVSALGVGALFGLKNDLIFYPTKGLEMTLAKTGWPQEVVWLEGLNGAKINSWYAPGPQEEGYTALILHGNGGNLNDMIGRIMTYHWLQMGVMAIDYQGYGLSTGEPSLEAVVQNAVAAYDYLVQVKKIPPAKIVVHGYSLGGGVAGQLVRLRPDPHPLVLDSTFNDLTEYARYHASLLGPLTNLVLRGAFDTRKALEGYKATVAIFLHSPEDEVVPYSLGQKLYESYYNGPKAFVNIRGSHYNYIQNQRLYEKALIDNLKLTFPKKPTAS
ncbi:MAG: alpha/beta hydrolase [Deltaproteobacteria bacterium]|jgi:predicted esterase|nr:alpha/beta hydrolase [Deltaproteobacteria bacterium]